MAKHTQLKLTAVCHAFSPRTLSKYLYSYSVTYFIAVARVHSRSHDCEFHHVSSCKHVLYHKWRLKFPIMNSQLSNVCFCITGAYYSYVILIIFLLQFVILLTQNVLIGRWQLYYHFMLHETMPLKNVVLLIVKWRHSWNKKYTPLILQGYIGLSSATDLFNETTFYQQFCHS